MRELGGLYLFGESLIIHTAHEFKASREHFRRVSDTINGYNELRSKIKSISTSHGEEAIELRPKPTLIFGRPVAGRSASPSPPGSGSWPAAGDPAVASPLTVWSMTRR